MTLKEAFEALSARFPKEFVRVNQSFDSDSGETFAVRVGENSRHQFIEAGETLEAFINRVAPPVSSLEYKLNRIAELQREVAELEQAK